MANVILINAFEVPAGKDEEFLQGWEAARDFMQRQNGYIATRLHRSLDPAARFRFINVAEWESPAAFQAALNQPEFGKLRAATPCTHVPSLYEVVRTEKVDVGGQH
jgi:heme-degrading monooxygenase HmoA